MSVFRGKIANLVTSGDVITKYEGGSWSRNIIRFDVGNYKCEINIHPDILKSEFKNGDYRGSLIDSGTIDIHGIKSASEGERILTDICWLLSLASMSHVIWFQYDFNGSGRGISVAGCYNSWRPVLEYQAKERIKNFMESSFCKYQDLKNPRKLSAVIHYLLKCDEPNQPLEISFLFTSIILESLKPTFAHQKYEYDGSGFLEPTKGKPKCANGSKCTQRYLSFETLLKEMFAEAGMEPDLKDIKKLRNEVVHNGLSEKSYEDMRAIYEHAQDLIREYLLRILGYKGHFWIYSAACRQMGKL